MAAFSIGGEISYSQRWTTLAESIAGSGRQRPPRLRSVQSARASRSARPAPARRDNKPDQQRHEIGRARLGALQEHHCFGAQVDVWVSAAVPSRQPLAKRLHQQPRQREPETLDSQWDAVDCEPYRQSLDLGVAVSHVPAD
jgi:hypothetical protein